MRGDTVVCLVVNFDDFIVKKCLSVRGETTFYSTAKNDVLLERKFNYLLYHGDTMVICYIVCADWLFSKSMIHCLCVFL